MKKTIFGLVSSFIFSASAFAGVIYSDSASFNAMLDTSVIDNYDNAGYSFIQNDAAMTNVLGETSYKATGHLNTNVVYSSYGNRMYCAGCNGSFLLDFTATSVSGDNGVFGVGFNFYNTSNPLYNALVTFGDGSTENHALAQAFNPGLKFWGITSALEISSIHFGLANGGTTQYGSFAIDNLTIGNSASAVPEPAGMLLLGLGLLGLATIRRKHTA